MSIATVVAISGQAWARDPDGNLRELAIGDALEEGETLVTSSNGSVQLDFDDGLPATTIGADEEVAMSNDVDAENAPDQDETVAQDSEVEALLSALEDEDGDLLELLEATAAGGGAAGGGGGGSDFVQLARIEESVQGLQYDYASGVEGGPDTVEFAEVPTADEEGGADDTVAVAGIILDPITGDDTINETEAGQIITLTGSVTGDAGEGDTVTLSIGDQTYSGLVDADGNFAIDVDGDVLAANDTVDANVSGSDDAGNEFSADTTRDYEVDTTAEAGITIDPVTDDNTINETEAGQTIAITGSVTGDAAEGDTVTLTIGENEYTGQVDADGNYSIDVDGNVLAENDTIEANVSGTDDAGNEFSADNSRDYNVDTEASATISIDPVTDDNTINETEAGQTIAITGSVSGDAAEGDTVTLTVGDQSYEGTVGEDLTYSIDVDGNVLAENDAIEANVSGTDDAGNEFSADNSRDYNVDTEASATISIDPVTDDNTINETEAGQTIAITGSVTGDAAEGDTVTLIIGENEYTGQVDADGNYSIDVDGDVLAENDTIEANVSGTDDAGNEFSADNSRDYNVDTEASATISIDAITGDDVINGEEAEEGNQITITGSVTGDAAEGDTVTLNVGENEYTGQVDAEGNYAIEVDGDVLASNDNIRANVSGTDEAGNEFSADNAREYMVDTTAEAGITIDPVTDDNTVNETEAGQTIAITGSVTGDAAEGDTVTLTVGDQSYEGTVGEDLTYSIDVDGNVLAENDTIEANVSGTDDAGNEFSADNSRDYNVDTEASATISIDPVTDDNTVNETEAGQTIAITGSVTGDAAEGDTVTLTVGDQSYEGTVGEDLTYSIDVDGDVLAENDTIEANVSGSDDAGNEFSADASRDYEVDTTAEAGITIDPVTDDNTINETEAGQTIAITGSVTGDAAEGDTVTLTIGENEYTGQVDADGNYSIDVDGNVLAENDTIEANVSGTDDAGNEFSADNSRDYNVDTEASATISIDPVTDDNTVNETEAGQTIAITGSVTGDAAEGDTVTLTVGDQSYEGTVGEDLTYSIDVDGNVLAENDTIEANVSGTDDAGNEFSADNSRDYNVDTEASATISIDPVTDDNTVNETEAGQTIAITGSVTGDAAEGDTVTLTVGDQSYEGTVGEDLTYSIDVDGNVLAENNTIEANVSGSDDAGNEFSADASRDYEVDTTAEAGITIDPVTDDNTVNETEAGQTIAITGSVTGDAAEGDTVTLTIGENEYTGQVDADGNYSIDVDGNVLAENDTIEANVSGTDDAGNEFSADNSRDYNVDTEASATISIDPVTDDNTVNETEAGQTIAITGSVTGDAAEGDTVTLTVGDQSYEGTVGEDLTYSIDVDGNVLAENNTIEANVSGSDDAGNEFSADASRDYEVDTTAEAGITIDPVTDDNTINETEAGQTIAITGSVSGDAAEGDTVTLTIGENEYTGQVDADGNYSIDVDGNVLAENDTIEANVSGSDDAGNEFSADASRDYEVDTTAEAGITIDPVTDDNTVNETEAGQTIAITGSVTGDAAEGDTVTLTIGENEYTGQVDADGNYSIDVDGNVLAENDTIEANVSGTDDAGNEFSADNSRDYNVDTEASATISIDAITGDDVINGEEAEEGNQITITGSVTGDAAEGDTVTLNVGENEYTGQVDAEGNYAIEVDGDVLASNDNIRANVSGTDEAGNEFSADNAREYMVDTTAEAGITIDPVTDDNTVNETEAGQTIAITGSVTGDAAEGDTVTLTVGDQSYEGTVGEDLTYSIDVDGNVLAENDTIEANVSGTDDAGNEFSADNSRDYNVDTEASATISIDPVTDDNTVNETEAGQTIAITGSVTGDAAEGDTVTLTVGDQSYEGTVGEDLTYSIDVDGNVLAENDTIEANVSGTDDAGNEFSADNSRDYNVDTEASATISIDPVTDDNTINETEAGQTIAITGSVTGDAAEGDTVTLTVGDQSYEGTVGEDLTYSIDVDGNVLAENDTIEANVTGTDDAGNDFSADASRDYNVAPDAQDDTNEVAFDETLTVGEDNGVLSNDTDPDDDPLTVSAVEGSAANVGEPIQGQFGTLTLNGDGSYDYVSNQPQPVLYGFVEGDDQLQNNLLNNFTLDTAAMQRIEVTDGKGVGVAGSDGRDVPEQINDNGEVMVADMGDSIEGAGFSFGVTNLFNNENGGESGAWYTYNEAGELVGSGTFGPDDVAYQNGSNNVGRVNVSADDAGDFRYIAFEGLAYENSDVDTDGGDYFLTDITLQESFDYTITDGQGGTDSATLTVDSTSNLAGYEAPLTLEASQEALVDEDGLENGIAGGPGDREGQGSDESTFTGKIGVAGAESLDFAGMNGQTATVGQEQVNYGWANGVLTATISESPAEGREGEALFTVELDDEGNYTVTLLENVLHETLDGEDGDNTENDASVALEYTAQNADGETQSGTLTLDFNDDTPTVDEADTVTVTNEGIPNIYVGNVDFTGNNGSQSQFSFADGNVVVTAQGFEGKYDLDLVDADVNQSSDGLGVDSDASPYHNLDNEIDFRKTADDEASETLTIALQNGQVAYGANIEFAKMFGGELETGVAEFYRDGELISTQSFSSDANSGNYADNFQVEDGGFDTIVLKADDNGKGPNHNDNSDFTVSSIEFTGSTGAPIGYAKSSLDVNYGADGPGSLALTGLAGNVALKDGSPVTDIDTSDNAIVARDGDGEMVFQLQLTPATGQWEFFQYQQLASSDIAFDYQVTDADGDSVDGSFALEAMANSAPESTDDEVDANAGEGLVLTTADFGEFSDPDSDDQLEAVRIDSLPDANAGALTLNGEAVEAGDVISTDAIANGELVYTQTNDAAEDTAFDFSVSDGLAWSEDSYSLTVNADAVPTASGETRSMDFAAATADPVSSNIYLTLDTSGSMNDKIQQSNGQETTRFELAKEALVNMINSYEGMGSVQVKLTTFNASATDHGWKNAEDAIALIEQLQAGGNTNYEDAVAKTVDDANDAPAADQTAAYFISDGEPTTENYDWGGEEPGLLDGIYQDDWNDFVSNHIDSLNVVALGSGINNTYYLDQLAEAGNNVSETLVVEDENGLDEAIDPVRLTLNGDLNDNVTGGDGTISFDSITVDGTTYTAADFADGSTIALQGDGQLAVDFAAGTYIYTATASEFLADTQKQFTVTASDADGDTANFDVIFDINVDTQPTASDEQALTADGSLEGNLLDNVDFGSDGQGTSGGLKSLKVGDVSYTPDENGQVTVNNVLGGTLNANLTTGEYTLSGAALGSTTLQVLAEDADGDEVAFDFDITSAGDNTKTETDDFNSGGEGWTYEGVGATLTDGGNVEIQSHSSVMKTYSGFNPGDTVEISFDAWTSTGLNSWEDNNGRWGDEFTVEANGDEKIQHRGGFDDKIKLEAIANDEGNIELKIDNNSSSWGENLYIDNVELTSGSSVGNILVGDDDSAEQFVLDDSSDDVTIERFDVANDVLDLSDLLNDDEGQSLDDYFVTASNEGSNDVNIAITQKNGQGDSKSVTLKDVSAEDLGAGPNGDLTHLIQDGKLDIE
ncbi:Ig-like domain-containing protein [Halomonas sp. HL-93]|uniref:Ig-like domain-containing protein n=1 Tax=Halomonas sp. HL-93 TaxID=1666906 RepID=UPI0007F124FB|nr:Ig-like domain-containing protein [Halomonas sp. HL-93]SBR50303.1 Ig-like domain (group 3) [Halomonas sp. HL-93]